MAGKVGDKDAEVQFGEFLGIEGHDFLVGGESVEEDDVAERRAGARFVEVGSHPATACRGQDGVTFERLAMREEKAEDAEQESCERLPKVRELHGLVVLRARWPSHHRAPGKACAAGDRPGRGAW